MFNRLFSLGTRTEALPAPAGLDKAHTGKERSSTVAAGRLARMRADNTLASLPGRRVTLPDGGMASRPLQSLQSRFQSGLDGQTAIARREVHTDNLASDIRRRLPMLESRQAQRYRGVLDNALAMRNPASRSAFVGRLHTLIGKAEQVQAARTGSLATSPSLPHTAPLIMGSFVARGTARRKEARIMHLGLKILRVKPLLAKRYLTFLRTVMKRQGPAAPSARLDRMARLMEARTRLQSNRADLR
jgi:hypothetical protein